MVMVPLIVKDDIQVDYIPIYSVEKTLNAKNKHGCYILSVLHPY